MKHIIIFRIIIASEKIIIMYSPCMTKAFWLFTEAFIVTHDFSLLLRFEYFFRLGKTQELTWENLWHHRSCVLNVNFRFMEDNAGVVSSMQIQNSSVTLRKPLLFALNCWDLWLKGKRYWKINCYDVFWSHVPLMSAWTNYLQFRHFVVHLWVAQLTWQKFNLTMAVGNILRLRPLVSIFIRWLFSSVIIL